MGSLKTQKPHVVLVPYPSQGHVTPFMTLAKLLHARGFYVRNDPRRAAAVGRGRNAGCSGAVRLYEEELSAAVQGAAYRLSAMPNVPPVSCVVSDGVMSFGMRAAEEMGIPEVQFWTASVCSFVGYLNFREIVRRGISPFKNDDYITDGTLDSPVDWIIGLHEVRLKDLPSFIRTTDPNDIMFDFMGEEAQNCLKAPAIIFNTFDDFEKEALEAVVSKFNFPNIYTIGPLPLLARHVPKTEANTLSSSLWKPDSKVFDWLDRQKPSSVVYVNYGSVTTMTGQHLQEFAWGLAKSQQPFLWVIRPDVVRGESAALPEEFLEESKARGLLVSWCAQDQVLAHKAVGAFLTHCGWNSMMESVCCGVPVICWPFFADQQTNCHYSCTKWGIGMEIKHDVKRDEVAELVKEMMEGEKGKKMRMKAQEWKKTAEAATDVGGMSYVNFDKFIKKGLHFED
ncbi:UNVERIFIED_CONTAM: Linamarin synthase 2 [Sesamum latifolium]|uniref:Glycosyltransferase n=1 Tax=Sesamum latifolium TaxID=2727402 RepID=A0AAW2X5Q3_9LAMI